MKTIIFICLICPLLAFGQSQEVKLLVDNGRYSESVWTRQMAVTADDKILIVNDFSNGLRFYDLHTGNLLNQFSAHSLEGDLYLDKENNILLTTGDKRIMIWDVVNQSLIKEIKQPFHSQFMNGVYIDSKKKFVFAENTKYDYATSQLVRRYSFNQMYFYKDRYYVFDLTIGVVNEFNVFTDELIRKFTIENYRPGYNVFFNELRGILVIGYSNGVVALDVVTGKSETILFNRSGTYDNLSVCSNYDFSADSKSFLATSNQRKGHIYLFEKDSQQWKSRISLKGVYNEVIFLNHSGKFVFTRGLEQGADGVPNNHFGLYDIKADSVVWLSSATIPRISSLYLNTKGNVINLNFGTSGIHFRTLNESGLDGAGIRRFFDSVSQYGYAMKSGISIDELPAEIKSLYVEKYRSEYFSLSHPFQKRLRNDDVFPVRGTEQNPYLDDGPKYSHTKNTIADLTSGKINYYSVKNGVKALIMTALTQGVVYHIEFSNDEGLSAFGGSDRQVVVVDLKNRKKLFTLWAESYVTSICFSYDKRHVFLGTLKNEIQMFSLITGKLVRKFKGSNGSVRDIDISNDNRLLFTVAGDNALRVWNTSDGKLRLTTYFDLEGGYLSFTPEGYFNKSDNFQGKVSFLLNRQNITFDQLFESYFRPDIVEALFAGNDTLMRKNLDIKKGIKTPPVVELNVLNGSVRGEVVSLGIDEMIKIRLKITDNGGGVKGFRLYNNNKLVEEKLLAQSLFHDSIVLVSDVVAVTGINDLRAIGISSDLTESKPVFLKCEFAAGGVVKVAARPNLYVVAIGIDDYKNSRYDLNYCVRDMQVFSDSIRSISNGIFDKFRIKQIANAEATKENILKAFDEVADQAQPGDVFIYYYAGHGIALDNDKGNTHFFFVSHAVTQMTDISNCMANGISDLEIREKLKKIKANKQIAFIDACNSGAMAEQFAIRGAAEENAIAKLSRATGSAIFASTTGDQYASEFAQIGHGVFTYVLLNALSGQASLANCQITAATLKSFIDDEVPKVTQKYRGKEQYPTTFLYGQDFPVGLRCKPR